RMLEYRLQQEQRLFLWRSVEPESEIPEHVFSGKNGWKVPAASANSEPGSFARLACLSHDVRGEVSSRGMRWSCEGEISSGASSATGDRVQFGQQRRDRGRR